jgi:hypothetical protein
VRQENWRNRGELMRYLQIDRGRFDDVGIERDMILL